MNAEKLIAQMERDTQRILVLVEGVSAEQAAWRSHAESWSILEVVNHLYDEEREDFRVRLDITLHNPTREWPPIDPRGWVTARGYSQRELAPSVQNWLDERRSSLAWLRSLGVADWEARYTAPFGVMSAGDLLASWVAHDLLHMRQLVELHRAYVVHLAEPYNTEYAGPW